ncbi:MAG: rRNA maturation RNase YbeY [Bacteroidales bacterium]|nr:rRNA maturation RNase YbeY [Bacteroidales bacterium]
MENITFNEQDVKVPFLKRRTARESLRRVLETLGFEPGTVNYIFCSDKYLLKINRQYLNHDTYTDIITFAYSEQDLTGEGFGFAEEGVKGAKQKNRLSGDIYISVPRIKENAKLFHVKQIDELNRVLVHGLLHLAGYKDKTPKEEALMHKMEDKMLASCFEGYASQK